MGSEERTEYEQIRWPATKPKDLKEARPESEPCIDKYTPPPFHETFVDTEDMAVENQKREFDRI